MRKRIFTSILALCLIAPIGAAAADLDIHYSILHSEIKGKRVHGVIEVRIVNTTGQAIHNVDLRLAQPGQDSIEKDLYQFGTIPAKQARIAVRRFIFSTDTLSSGNPVVWQVDFDDSTKRNHKRAVVSGKHDDRKGGRK